MALACGDGTESLLKEKAKRRLGRRRYRPGWIFSAGWTKIRRKRAFFSY
jgi:hypothetical protein